MWKWSVYNVYNVKTDQSSDFGQITEIKETISFNRS